jgi:ABC-type Mn2+/Zn2+ transport system ATPase subunit
VRGADTNNLQDVDVDIPLGVLVVLTGVAGSGKSSLINGSVAGRDGVVTVDQGAIRGSREQPGDVHRAARPDPQGVRQGQRRQAGAVQRQLRRRLPQLQRRGRHLHRAGMMAGAATPARSAAASASTRRCSSTPSAARTSARCSRCRSPRPRRSSAPARRRCPAAHKILERLADVGLGYLTIGQPLTTLSGRRAPAAQAGHPHGEDGGVYVLDEPTTGLHLADVAQLLGLLDRLVESGKSVIVIEHDQAVMAHADWIIDLGPGAGQDGGRIVFEGTPADLVADRSTLTGEHLAAYVAA